MILKKLRSRRGLTLVELVATIAISAIVLLGVSAVLLSALRTNLYVNNEVAFRAQTGVILKAVRRWSDEGLIRASGTMVRNGETLLWLGSAVPGEDETPLMRYNQTTHTLWVGENLMLSDPNLELAADVTDKLLTLSLTLNSHSYTMESYLRFAPDPPVTTESSEDPASPDASAEPLSVSALPAGERAGRNGFLEVLLGQYGSAGEIVGGDGYYSEWYLGGSYAFSPEWNEETPWCACFLSWALAQLPADALAETPRFADVDEGAAWFRDRAGGWLPPEATPLPGDLVFFDWEGDGDPDHVGAVLSAGADGLTTLEGNRNSAVTSAAYRPGDPAILGYGRLAWRGA